MSLCGISNGSRKQLAHTRAKLHEVFAILEALEAGGTIDELDDDDDDAAAGVSGLIKK